MDNPRSPLLTWPYFYQGKSMEELRQSLLYTTLELESTRVAAQEEIRKREEELAHLQELLSRAVKERDEAQEKCRNFLLEKLLMQQQQQQNQQQKSAVPAVHSGVSSIEDEPNYVRKDGFSSSDCEESIFSSPPPPPPRAQPVQENALQLLSTRKPLPEKGKLLQAVMKAGPLLQTLILAGPLPQWRHPPPPLQTFEIPPVQIPAASSAGIHQSDAEDFLINCGAAVNRKRSFLDPVFDGSSPQSNKYQRVLLH